MSYIINLLILKTLIFNYFKFILKMDKMGENVLWLLD